MASGKIRLNTLLILTLVFHGLRVEAMVKTSDSTITKIILFKSTRTLKVYHNDILLKTFKVALGKFPKGAKHQEGDKKTPEGTYFIDAKNPKSQYHKALHISYPSKKDWKYARSHRISPGSDVEIHGLPQEYAYLGKTQSQIDWTWGCIALSNQELDSIYPWVKVGTPIILKP